MARVHRKLVRRFEVNQQPRFLTFSCFDRLQLLKNDKIKQAFIERLQAAREQTHFRLISWVIMPEHVHLIIVPALPEFPLSKVLPVLKRRFAEQVIRRWKQLRAPVLKLIRQPDGSYRFWQHGGGFDRNVRDDSELWEKMNYIHVNPVKRGLAESPVDYPWSSARWYSGPREREVEIDSIW